MQNDIVNAQQRLVIVKMLIELMRIYVDAYFEDGRSGSTCSDMLLCAAVFTGQAEGRPMTAGKLAEFAGIPRPTVIRRLAALEQDGILERSNGVYCIRGDLLNSSAVTAAADGAMRQVIRAAAKLSKMDS